VTTTKCTVIHRHQFTKPVRCREVQHKLFNHSIFNDSNINDKTISQVTSMMSPMKTYDIRCKHVIRSTVHVLPDNNYLQKVKQTSVAASAMNYGD